MNTSYDAIYEKFKDIMRTSSYNLPSTEEQIYGLINTGVTMYNSRDEKDIKCDNMLEQVDMELTEWQILVIANFMKLIQLNNILTEKSTIFTTFTKEIGVRNIQSQTKAMESLIKIQEKELDSLFFQSEDEDINEIDEGDDL